MSLVIQNSKDLIELIGSFSILDFPTEEGILTLDQAPSSMPAKKSKKLETILGEDLGVESLMKQIELHLIRDMEKYWSLQELNQSDREILNVEMDKLRKEIFNKVVLMAKDCRSRNPSASMSNGFDF